MLERFISVVIANYNKAATVGQCLESVFASKYRNFEVVVVDDRSTDNSIEIIQRYPCRLIQLDSRSGASRARNAGAAASRGEIIFFTDSDCLLLENTLSAVNSCLIEHEKDTVLGGTYTALPYDKDFYSIFQSIFVHHSETKRPDAPDYIAAHAMAVWRSSFIKTSGFPERFLPILEDVEFSHRARRSGFCLRVAPHIQVRHVFSFTFIRSFMNAVRKTRFWVMYSLRNRDALTDSGTASFELKFNVMSFCLIFVSLVLWIAYRDPYMLFSIPLLFAANGFVSRKLLTAFFDHKGAFFAVRALVHYTLPFALMVGIGTASGIWGYLFQKELFAYYRPGFPVITGGPDKGQR